MKVKATKASKSATATVLDLFSETPVSAKAKAQAQQEIGEYLVEVIRDQLAEGKSVVVGESFPALSPEYAKRKKEEIGTKKANLEFSGDMLDALEFRTTKTGIEIGVFGDEAPKADGHNQFSGKGTHLPKRRFLPGEGQSFSKAIRDEVTAIIQDAVVDTTKFTRRDFAGVETKADLYGVLGELFGEGYSRPQLKMMALRSGELLDLLTATKLIKLL